MRKVPCISIVVALFGVICVAQAPDKSGQAPASAQQPQHTDVYEQGPPPPPEAKQPEIPQRSTDQQQPLPGDEKQPLPSDAQQSGSQESTPTLKTRPQPVKTIPTHRTLNAGTEIRASLDKVISSKSSQAGDEFTATIMEPVMNQEGQVLVHSGAKIHGRIAGIERGKVFGSVRNATARLNLRFTDLVLDSGEPLPMQASLLGLDESSTKSKAKSNEEGDISPNGTNGKEVLRDIGMGAGGGTLAGLIFGGAWKGAIIGALAGGGYVLANQGRDVELPASTGMRIRLDKYLTIPEYALQSGAAQPAMSHDTQPSTSQDVQPSNPSDNPEGSSSDRPVLKKRPAPQKDEDHDPQN
ncbi:MAG TPA: hypothetical protein VMU24_08195 [Candidatus Acidoferrales bacterium]|nr:hypothetical protein [Candidatus Acidoferrales bacterium]